MQLSQEFGMIEIETHPEGAVLPLKVHPGAKKNEVRGEHDSALRVSVTQAPEKGRANKAIIELLAKSLGLKRSQFELLSGQASSQKRFLVKGITTDVLHEILGRLIYGD